MNVMNIMINVINPCSLGCMCWFDMAQYTSSRRMYLKGVATLGMAGIAGCLGGGGSDDSSGNGGSQHNWVYDQTQKPGPEIRYQSLGAVEGDPAVVANMKLFEKKTDLKINPIVTDPSSVLRFARTRLQGKDTKMDLYSLQPYDGLSPKKDTWRRWASSSVTKTRTLFWIAS